MTFDAQEIEKLTDMHTRAEGKTALDASLEQRRWHYDEQAYRLAGDARQKDLSTSPPAAPSPTAASATVT